MSRTNRISFAQSDKQHSRQHHGQKGDGLRHGQTQHKAPIGIVPQKFKAEAKEAVGQQQLTADILIKPAVFYDVSIDYILRQTQTPKRLK